jgi:hypothetical protein
MRYLLAAEADHIQNYLFRSARLREVVGGSQLLSRFCRGVPEALAESLGIRTEVITSGGGSFYIEFETAEDARRFGAALAEIYYRATGSTLSVAEPVAFEETGGSNGYRPASEAIGANLRQAKRQGIPTATVHIPYIAFCESCGTGLAVAHEAHPDKAAAHYVCESCLYKFGEAVTREQVEGTGQYLGEFLKSFYSLIEQDLSQMDWPQIPEDVAQGYDDRGYVGYIVADGDGMGKVFHSCTKEQARTLSKKMDEVLRHSLAVPIQRTMRDSRGRHRFMPALPLILGGDDLFALVPAPWALDIARHLCQTFQREMTDLAEQEGIKDEDGKKIEITMTASVVICKANYPYYLAHDIGEHRLAEAKRVVKSLAAATGLRLSAVDFEIVLGSQIEPEAPSGNWRPSLRPYWVVPETDAEDPRLNGWGIPLHTLLDQRYRLRKIPSKRRSQLRALFDRAVTLGSEEDFRSEFGHEGRSKLAAVLKRIERDWETQPVENSGQDQEQQQKEHPVRATLKQMGWYDIKRSNDPVQWKGHGMGDLLRAWNWTLSLDHDSSEYEGGER